MREIKFRAWLRDKKEMYYSDQNTASRMNGLELFTQKVGNAEGFTPEVMQSTGLKDKNGVLIYEGDILKCSRLENEITIVEYIDDMFHLKSTRHPNLSNGNYRMATLADTSEIIGNIYENPELLK